MLVALCLLLVAAVSAQLDLSDRDPLSVDASVYLHVEVQNVFYRTTTPARVVFGFDKGGLLLPIKDKLEDEAASEKNLAKPYFFSRSSCVALALNSTGKVALSTPSILIDDVDAYVFQWVGYADLISYADFTRPFFEFEVSAFKQTNAASTSCTPIAGTDGPVTKQNFTERLCFTEDSFCNYWIGDDSDGWLYFGGGNTSTTAEYGVQVFPRWNWTGTREEFTLNETNYLDVRPVDSSSDSAGTFTLSKTTSAPFEFNDCNVLAGGALVFNIDENGNLVRYLSCNSLELSEYAHFVFDFDDTFDEAKLAQWKLPGVDKWNFTLPPVIRVKYASTFTVRVDPDEYLEPYVELNRLPDGYELDGANWLTTLELRPSQFDLVRTWFTVVKPVVGAPTTTAAPTTTRTPAPTLAPKPCPKDCSSAGSCNTNTGVCDCGSGFIVDTVLGCKAAVETTLAGQTAVSLATADAISLSATTGATLPPQTEPPRTQNVGIGTGTGTRRTTRPIGVTNSTAGAAQIAVSFAAVLAGVALAF